MKVTGKIKLINQEQTFGSNGFRKRECVITTSEQYPQDIQIEFVQDKCDLLNNFNVGDTVDVSINLRGREWINPQGEAKYFNTIQGWRIESSDVKPEATMEQQGSNNEPDDLPF